MIKVLRKSFEVLEHVYRQSEPVLPQEVARRLELPQATAVRILRDLAEMGYLEQAGPRKGYCRGPMSFVLADAEESEFLRFARYHIEQTAGELGQAIVLSRRHRNYRCVLCHSNHNPAFAVDADRVRAANLYRTTSGRLLLAYASREDVDAIVRADGLPSPGDWPEAAGRRAALDAQLAAIRKSGRIERYPSCDGQSNALALPLFRDGQLFGAVAAYWSLQADEKLSHRCIAAAGKLVKTLSESRKAIAV